MYPARNVWPEQQVHEAEEHDELLELDPVPAVDVTVAVQVVDLLLGHLHLEFAKEALQLLVVDCAI